MDDFSLLLHSKDLNQLSTVENRQTVQARCKIRPFFIFFATTLHFCGFYIKSIKLSSMAQGDVNPPCPQSIYDSHVHRYKGQAKVMVEYSEKEVKDL